ncbi:hypothetical protein [Lysinibacillus contaminans]|uniref:hypothetical protein n=1 Tax=Lysinibacillus contaminans TaxID=1293441 RepID=UPI0006AE29E4|nr:hypothetical protein [Lysinibacillus contaminans]
MNIIRIEFDTPEGLEAQIRLVVLTATKEAIEQSQKQLTSKEYFTIKEACEYINVSFATFSKFRTLGLHVIEIDGVKRVNKKVINEFLENHSF